MKKFLLGFTFVLFLTPSLVSAAVSPQQVERALGIFFKNDPVMIAIAKCESGFRHWGSDGSVLRGGAGGEMIGLYQIYDSVHRAQAEAIGLDINSLVGNILYAKVLYTFQGTTPWRSCL